MDNSFRRHGSDTKPAGGLLVSLHIFNSILHWLAGLIELTEEEQKDAGVYLDDQRFK